MGGGRAVNRPRKTASVEAGWGGNRAKPWFLEEALLRYMRETEFSIVVGIEVSAHVSPSSNLPRLQFARWQSAALPPLQATPQPPRS